MSARGGGLAAGLGIGAAVAAFLLFSSNANASPADLPPEDLPLPDPVAPDFSIPIPEIIVTDPLSQFLFMVRTTENSSVADFDRYSRFYGNSTFSNFSDHPVITKEKTGVPLPAALCIAAGFKPGCVSTAAGAYQIIRPTWDRVRAAGVWGSRLPDFGRDSQDEAARRLLLECGVLPLLRVGDLSGAIGRASKLWASLPGSTAKQNPVTLAQAIEIFNAGA